MSVMCCMCIVHILNHSLQSSLKCMRARANAWIFQLQFWWFIDFQVRDFVIVVFVSVQLFTNKTTISSLITTEQIYTNTNWRFEIFRAHFLLWIDNKSKQWNMIEKRAQMSGGLADGLPSHIKWNEMEVAPTVANESQHNNPK